MKGSLGEMGFATLIVHIYKYLNIVNGAYSYKDIDSGTKIEVLLLLASYQRDFEAILGQWFQNPKIIEPWSS